MIENCIKMECVGCRKLIPTHLFYEHLTQSNQNCMVTKSQNLRKSSNNMQSGINIS